MTTDFFAPRLASVHDMPAMLELAREEHAASSWAAMPFDPQVWEMTMHSFITGFGRTAWFNGQGYFFGLVQPAGFSGARMALEFAWFARRGGMALLHKFEEWAAHMGAHAVIVHDYAGHQRLAPVLERRYGYTPIGVALKKHLE